MCPVRLLPLTPVRTLGGHRGRGRKSRGISNRGHIRAGHEGADPRHRHQALADRILLRLSVDRLLHRLRRLASLLRATDYGGEKRPERGGVRGDQRLPPRPQRPCRHWVHLHTMGLQ